ncbi:MAG: WXG100 family type VII secretion target [Erysipelotrichaceae bacterium]|nr:WXG100 family type VII secretion target [Erysipelotrichaceae bacterium]
MILEFDYFKVMRQVHQLRDLSESLKKELKKIENMENSLGSSWSSDAASVFRSKLHESKRKLKFECSKLDYLADTIEELARRLKKADDSAIRAVKSL